MDLHEPGPLLSLWRNRNYILLWTGQMVSQLGTGVSQIAYPLLILALTHSPTKAGIAGAIYSLPYLLFSLPAGALGSIPIASGLGHLTLAQLYVTAAVDASLYVFFNIAEVACLPR